MTMIARFSLYGFLKNCNFAEPFLILFYLSLDLSYFEIGLLVAFQNLVANLLEIPSGAAADLYGKKSCMIFSLGAYTVSFVVFFLATGFTPLLVANLLFAFGEAFRTGTHKAIIFDWLRQNDLLADRTRVYGLTRSWAKYGSAAAVIVAAVIVIFSPGYRWVFAFSILPYLAGIVNLMTYPASLNQRRPGRIGPAAILRHSWRSLFNALRPGPLQRLIVQNLGFESAFTVTKDYLQPILKAQALILAAAIVLSTETTIAIVVGAVYAILHVVSALASRRAHTFARLFSNETRALDAIILAAALLALLSAAGLGIGVPTVAIAAFVAYYLLDNLWRPIMVAQYDTHAKGEEQATILSIEAQAKTFGVMILAPVAGRLVDRFGLAAAPALGGGVLLLLGLASALAARRRERR
jgi:MFS family permease